MGKILEEKKKKKKGRPSLIDLQKRSLKQQLNQIPNKTHHLFQFPNKTHQLFSNPNPNPNSRVPRNPNPNPNSDDHVVEEGSCSKKSDQRLNLVINEAQLGSPDEVSGSDSNPGSPGSNRKRRKIVPKDEKLSSVAKQTSIHQGSELDDGPITPLPDKKLLLFILDRLQKKDTYGVFSDPVDPEELLDYFEIVDLPMDFSTVRKKLSDDAYANLEQFEKDIFLICSNAMQYNSPDTIYFRQARSIHEMAKKDFDNLRQESDDNEPESVPKVARRGRPPTKHLKRPLGRPPLERPDSNFPEAMTGGITNRSNNDMRKGLPISEKQGPPNLIAQSLYGEASNGWSAERYERSEDMTGSSKGISAKNWKKKNIVIDENRRNTYKTCASACRQEPPVLTTFDGEKKLLISVGLHAEYGYGRSLSRFAAKFGPIAWKVASRKIERCLPANVKFGPGWVGENEDHVEAPTQQQLHGDMSSAPTQVMVEPCRDKLIPKPENDSLPEVSKSSSQLKLDDGSTQVPVPSSVPSNGAGSKLNSKLGLISQAHQSSEDQTRVNGLNGSYGLNFASQMGKMIGAARPTNVSNLQTNSSLRVCRTETQGLGSPSDDSKDCVEAKLLVKSNNAIKSSDCLLNVGQLQRVGSGPPDLNVGFQSPGSPSPGRADSLHPDLALQL